MKILGLILEPRILFFIAKTFSQKTFFAFLRTPDNR